MREHQVVVVFDVEAADREAAHQAVAGVMDFHQRTPGVARLVKQAFTDVGVESWWFPEPDAKHIDGNDRSPMYLAEVEDPHAEELVPLANTLEWLYNQARRIRASESPFKDRVEHLRQAREQIEAHYLNRVLDMIGHQVPGEDVRSNFLIMSLRTRAYQRFGPRAKPR